MVNDIVLRCRELVAVGHSATNSLRTVADEFETITAAVRQQYYTAGGNQERDHGRQYLSSEQSATLRMIALAFSGANLGWNKKILALAVETLFNITVKKKWIDRWI